jgi:outer membrane protein insertion porin family
VAFKDATSLGSAALFDVLQDARQRRSEGTGQSHMPVPGAPLSSAGIEDARITLMRRYRDEGFLYARIFPDVRLSDDGTAAEVTFRFEEGPQVRIDNLLVRGNLHTMSGLIRRRMLLREGDLYRLDQALQDQRSVAGLGVFSSVRVRLVDEETPAERKDVVAEVVERNRQAFELWPGLSTADGPRLRLDYSHLNLGGTATSFGASLKLNLKMFFDFYGDYAKALRERYATFNFRERLEIQARAGVRSPRFGVRPVEGALRLDLVGERTNAIAYSLDAGRAIFGIELFTFDRLGLTIEPQLSLTNLRCFTPVPNVTCSTQYQRNSGNLGANLFEGLRAEFRVGPSITLDLRDDALNPRQGLLASARWVFGVGKTVEEQYLTGSDFGLSLPPDRWEPFQYTKAEVSVSGYVPVRSGVLAVTARGGRVLTGTVKFLDERFYLGGSTTMRGFPEAAMFADDVCVVVFASQVASLPGRCVYRNVAYAKSQDGRWQQPLPQGGDYFFVFKTEARVPVGGQFLLTLFADVGNVWLTMPSWKYIRLRANPGLGLRYATPAGPIGIDVGFTPDWDPLRGENLVNVQLAVGVF